MYIKLHSKDVMNAMEDATVGAVYHILGPYTDYVYWSESIASLDLDAWHEVKRISDGYFMVDAGFDSDAGSLFWIPPWAVAEVKDDEDPIIIDNADSDVDPDDLPGAEEVL